MANDIENDVSSDVEAQGSVANAAVNQAHLISRWRFLGRHALLCVCGALFAAGFPPFNQSWLGWAGVIPLFWLVRNLRWQEALLGGWLWGYGWNVAGLFWLKEIEPFIPFLFGAILALFPAAWAAAIPTLRRAFHVPLGAELRGEEAVATELVKYNWPAELAVVFILSCWWCALEWIRTWIGTGFPWNLLAVTQWRTPSIIQICSWTGVYGVSFILVFFNLSIVHALITWSSLITERKYRRPVTFMVALTMLTMACVVGSSRLRPFAASDDIILLRVLLVQPDIPQCRFANDTVSEKALEVNLLLTEPALSEKPDVVVWPETAVPIPYRGGGELSSRYRGAVASLIDRFGSPFLIGSIDFRLDQSKPDGVSISNSALLIGEDGQIKDSYNKTHLVPWGEYTPYGEYYPWLKKKFGMGRSLTPGVRRTIFPLGKEGAKAAVLICYEDVFPAIARGHTLAGANMLLTITNDAWYNRSGGPEQHLAQAVFRAVENRRPLIRSGNNSGSCVIQPNGMVTDLVVGDDGEFFCRKAEVVELSVAVEPPLTFYTVYGDLFSYACLLCSLFGFAWALWRWRIKAERLSSAFKA